MAKSTRSPHTHTAVTVREIVTVVGPSKYGVVVPAGTTCRKLDGGSDPWVVEDLSWMDRGSILHHDADHYGIRIKEVDLVDIKPR